jgi:hypothetical protein
MNPKKYDGTDSRSRLAGELAGILERPVEHFDPDEISWVTERIGITDYEGARDAQLDGCYVINVADELTGNLYDNLDIPFTGTAKELCEQINNFADEVSLKLEADPKSRVVVHCAMGMERAPLAVVGYLTKYQNMTVDEAYELIVSKRPIACDRRLWMDKGMWTW